MNRGDRTRNRNAKQTNSYSSCGCEKQTEAKTLLEKRLKPRERGRLETAMFVKARESNMGLNEKKNGERLFTVTNNI